MHLSSIEVRWFWTGDLQSRHGLSATFETFQPTLIKRRADVSAVRWSDPRDDVYLSVPTAVDLGIKWREGELQTKGRRAVLGTMRFASRVHGSVEQWIKWSHEGPAVDASVKPFFASGTITATVTVWKRRALRKMRMDPFGGIEEVPDREHIDRGASIELTDLKIGGAPYCSMAFEAFPDDGEMIEQVAQLATAFLGGFDPALFDEAQSLSYPAFLDQLPRRTS